MAVRHLLTMAIKHHKAQSAVFHSSPYAPTNGKHCPWDGWHLQWEARSACWSLSGRWGQLFDHCCWSQWCLTCTVQKGRTASLNNNLVNFIQNTNNIHPFALSWGWCIVAYFERLLGIVWGDFFFQNLLYLCSTFVIAVEYLYHVMSLHRWCGAVI